MLRSQNRKGRNASTRKAFQRASVVFALSLVAILGLAMAFVFSSSAEARSAHIGRTEMRGAEQTITREFHLRGGAAFSGEASARLAKPSAIPSGGPNPVGPPHARARAFAGSAAANAFRPSGALAFAYSPA